MASQQRLSLRLPGWGGGGGGGVKQASSSSSSSSSLSRSSSAPSLRLLNSSQALTLLVHRLGSLISYYPPVIPESILSSPLLPPSPVSPHHISPSAFGKVAPPPLPTPPLLPALTRLLINWLSCSAAFPQTVFSVPQSTYCSRG